MTVLAAHDWKTNGHLIADVAKLGYIKSDDLVFDLTYGKFGVWWKQWRPDALHHLPLGADFREHPGPNDAYDVVACDPPYKLNGTPTPDVDERYGVHVPATWRERIALMHAFLDEALRIARPGGVVLFKCMDQVCSGKIRWQTRWFTNSAHFFGRAELVDRFDMTGQHREQPMEGRTQRHAHGRPSTLLVFKKS